MPMTMTTPMSLTASMVELRFLVPPTLVEAARQALAPYVLASVLPDAAPRQITGACQSPRPFRPVSKESYTGVTQKELELLLRE